MLLVKFDGYRKHVDVEGRQHTVYDVAAISVHRDPWHALRSTVSSRIMSVLRLGSGTGPVASLTRRYAMIWSGWISCKSRVGTLTTVAT